MIGLILSITSSLASDAPVAPTRARCVPDGRYISWREHRIDDEGLSHVPLRGADGLAVADLDRDGHRDIVSVHEDSSHVRIAFGGDDPDRWDNRTLASGDLVGAAEDVDIGDLNGDGRADVVIACEQAHLVVFIAPKDARDVSAWRSVILAATRGRGSWIRVKIADLNGDGRPDIVGANKGQAEFSYFHLDGDADDPAAWTEVVIGRCKTPINVHPVDFDGDGDLDLIAASRGERKLLYYENRGPDRPWREVLIHEGEPATEGFMMVLADLDADGRLDLLTEADHAGEVFWFGRSGRPPSRPDEQRPRSGRPPSRPDEQTPEWHWSVHLIGTIAPDHATGLGFADINGDGRRDLIVGGYSAGPRLHDPENSSPKDPAGRLAWFEQPEDPTKTWPRHDVSRRRRGMFDMFIPADLNGDGLVDFITTRGNSGEYDGVLWLEQVRTDAPAPAFRPARERDSAEMPLPTDELPAVPKERTP